MKIIDKLIPFIISFALVWWLNPLQYRASDQLPIYILILALGVALLFLVKGIIFCLQVWFWY